MRNRSENQVESAEKQIELVFIRHGVTPSNKEHRYLGKTDESLSDEGKEELTKRKEQNSYPKIDCLFTSPMKRCLETARILYPDQKIHTISEWEEMDFGAFEGKNYKDLENDERYQAWIDSNGTLPFPEGESREDFIVRCKIGFMQMLQKLAETESFQDDSPKKAGIIVHGGTIMALLSAYCGGDYFDYQVSNASGYACMCSKKEDRIELEIRKKF